jgi:hypothetical protein
MSIESEIELVGFALSDCTVNIDEACAKYLRIVHRTALELSVQNQFGADIGGFWLMAREVEQLRRLPQYYPGTEALLVHAAVEAYLAAQLELFYCEIFLGHQIPGSTKVRD